MANQILLNMNMVGLLNDEKMKTNFDNVSFQKIAHNTTPKILTKSNWVLKYINILKIGGWKLFVRCKN
jgi:hypothetical protein